MTLSVKSYSSTTRSQTGFGNNEIKKSYDMSSSNPEPKKSGLSTTEKYMIGATALASTVAFGIIGHKSNWWRKAAQQTDKLGENNREVISELKQLTLDKFKEVGAFVKGKAKLTNGEMYSGTITKQNKDGTTLTLEYKDGVLQKSSTSDARGVFKSKEYEHDDSERLTKIFHNKQGSSGELFKHGETTFSYHTDTGKIKEIRFPDRRSNSEQVIYCDKTGRAKYVKYSGLMRHLEAAPPENSYVEFDTLTGKLKRAWYKGTMYTYDKNGNPTGVVSVADGFSKEHVAKFGKNSPDGDTELEIFRLRDPKESMPNFKWNKHYKPETDEIYQEINIKDKRTGNKFFFEREYNRNWSVTKQTGDTYKWKLEQHGDIADISIRSSELNPENICAKYNMKTKELDILPEYKDSAPKIQAFLDEISSVAQDAKRIIRGYTEYFQQKKDFYNELREHKIISGDW